MIYETTVDHVSGEDFLIYYTSEKKYLGKLRKLVNEYPDQVKVKVDDGQTLGVTMPANWFRPPKPPTKRNLTDEQKKIMTERLRQSREVKQLP